MMMSSGGSCICALWDYNNNLGNNCVLLLMMIHKECMLVYNYKEMSLSMMIKKECIFLTGSDACCH